VGWGYTSFVGAASAGKPRGSENIVTPTELPQLQKSDRKGERGGEEEAGEFHISWSKITKNQSLKGERKATDLLVDEKPEKKKGVE